MAAIACNLSFARTCIFAKLAAIFFSVWRYTNAGQVSALLRRVGHDCVYPLVTHLRCYEANKGWLSAAGRSLLCRGFA
jgi:hypothetical protein